MSAQLARYLKDFGAPARAKAPAFQPSPAFGLDEPDAGMGEPFAMPAALPPAQRYIGLSDALGYTDFFAKRGVSADQARTCLADASKADKIAKLAEKYGNDGISGTPTLLINGNKLDGNTWDVVEAALQKAGAR